MLSNGLVRQGCESTANFNWIGIVKDNKEGLRMTSVIFSRCAVFGSRFPFLKKLLLFSNFLLVLDFTFTCCCYFFFGFNVDYSVYVINIALFRTSLFLSHIWTPRLKSSKLWSWQLWTQFKQLRIEAAVQYMKHFIYHFTRLKSVSCFWVWIKCSSQKEVLG